MINLEWVRHGAGAHELFAASADAKDGAEHALITAYPVRLPDGTWSVMTINKDPSNAHSVRLAFQDGRSEHATFAGPITMVTFGTEQYVWHSEGPTSHADPNQEPVTSQILAAAEVRFTLPKASITVLRGQSLLSRIPGLNIRASTTDERGRAAMP